MDPTTIRFLRRRVDELRSGDRILVPTSAGFSTARVVRVESDDRVMVESFGGYPELAIHYQIGDSNDAFVLEEGR